MQRSLPGEALVLVPALDQAVDEVARAIADLRTIAAGLRPPRLDDGLAAALGDLARSSPMPVVVHVDAERIPPPLELVAYYTVCEAVTNAIKHASASRIEVEALRDGGRLVIRIRDDGAGGAVARGATGLAGVADRVGAHGGRLTIDSPPGEGTLLEAVLPCAS
jgi:signal transduction histidine kinase